jgi:hypothetical protein
MAESMNPALIGFLGTLVGAVASFAGTAVSNWFMLRKERESRRDQQRFEFEKWRRELLQSNLLSAASQIDLYVTKWLPHKKDLARAHNDHELVKLSSEVKKGVLALLMVFPEKTLDEYIQLGAHAHKANHTAIVLEDEAWAMRQLLISLAIKYGATDIHSSA